MEQAKGVLAERAHVDVDVAFDIMRRYARRHRMLLSDLSRAVIDRRVSATQLGLPVDLTAHVDVSEAVD